LIFAAYDAGRKNEAQSRFSEAGQIAFGINAPIVPVRERNVQPIAKVGDLHDSDPGKALGEAFVEAGAGAMRTFAG
jgi:hypothetical protein